MSERYGKIAKNITKKKESFFLVTCQTQEKYA